MSKKALGNEEKCPQQVHIVVISFGHYPKKEEKQQELINNLAHSSVIIMCRCMLLVPTGSLMVKDLLLLVFPMFSDKRLLTLE